MLKAMSTSSLQAKYANLIDEADWREFVNYRTKDEKFLKISEQNRKRASNPIYPYRASRMGHRGVEEKITPSRAAVDLDVLWVDARKNKQGVVDNEKVQEAVNRVDKYDSLAERFHTMEKRMEAVVIGTVYNTQDAIIHHAQIPSNHLKVSIDISIEDDALLPIPVDEDIITVGLALATFVAWPKHLIDVNLPADSTINISLPDPNYGYSTEEYITKNDVTDVHRRDWIGASILSVYIRYLYDNAVPKSKKKVMFISLKQTFWVRALYPRTHGRNRSHKRASQTFAINCQYHKGKSYIANNSHYHEGNSYISTNSHYHKGNSYISMNSLYHEGNSYIATNSQYHEGKSYIATNSQYDEGKSYIAQPLKGAKNRFSSHYFTIHI
ncbi:hypothetical protein Lal_00032200 [Lupinus albus]|nr:hypothetical protein Lal_00032200 [Lupinus albus]